MGICSWDLYPGISVAAEFNQGNGEGGREDSASDTFCRQKSLCQHDALAEGAGTMVAALPSGRSPHSCPPPLETPLLWGAAGPVKGPSVALPFDLEVCV